MPSLNHHGYTIADLVLTASACHRIADELPQSNPGRGGVRNVLATPVVLRIVQDPRFARAIREAVDGPLAAVKATLFDKTPRSNWRVQWHQDRVIAVRERIDLEGFGPWSVKGGIPHVEAPAHVLANMLAVRVHLDDTGPDNGPLRVIPGSHRHGKLADEEILRLVSTQPQVGLAVPQGAVLLMRPLLLHASSPATVPAHRRVLHIELAPPDLIAPLQWHSAVPV